MKKYLILLLTILLIPIYVNAEEINKEYLDNKLTLINDNYTFNENVNIEESLLSEINKIITEENIEKNINCTDNKCILKLKYEEIESNEKEITINIKKTYKLYKNSHVQDIGWKSESNDNIIGTTHKSKRLEAFMIKIRNIEGNLLYRSYVEGLGWQDYVSNGEVSGTTGQSKKIEVIRIKLDGEMANEYDIYYRVHVSNIGWLGWAKNGENAGTLGYDNQIEAIDVKLVEKEDTSIITGDSYRSIGDG